MNKCDLSVVPPGYESLTQYSKRLGITYGVLQDKYHAGLITGVIKVRGKRYIRLDAVLHDFEVPENYWTLPEACAELGVSRSFIMKRVGSIRGAFKKLGRWLIPQGGRDEILGTR
jgi:predicted site-specific integrase-resolvase